MNCPHCKKDLPQNTGEGNCPACGGELSAHKHGIIKLGVEKITWPIFWILLFAPPVLTILAVWLSAKNSDVPTGIGIFGGGLSGIICGVFLGKRIGKTTGGRIGLGILFAIIMAVACI